MPSFDPNLIPVAIPTFGWTAALVWSLNSLALCKWRRAAGRHWAERAALLFPARVSAGMNVFYLPIISTCLAHAWRPDASILGLAISSYAGALIGSYPLEREIHPDLNFHTWLHLLLAGLVLRWGVSIPFAVAAFTMPPGFTLRTWLTAAAFFALLLALQYGLSLRSMRWLRLLQPAPLRLRQIVDQASATLGVPVKAVWLLKGPSSNAMAFVTTRELAFTEGLLAHCTDDEIRAITAHELAHLSESRRVVALRIAGRLSFAPFILVRPIVVSFGPAGAALLSLGTLLVGFVVLRVARAKELVADRFAIGSGAENAIYAHALERLHQANQIPAVMRGKSVHPHLYDRMLAAGVTPDFPRPDKPRAQYWTSYLVVIAAVLAIALTLAQLENGLDDIAVALNPGSAAVYLERGDDKQESGDFDGAIADYTKAADINPKDHNTYHKRGNSRQSRRDYAGAVADYGRAIVLDGKRTDDYYERGIANELMGNFEGAFADYGREVALLKDAAVYSRFRLSLVAQRLKYSEPPGELTQVVAQWKDGWPKSIGQYLTHQLPEADFLARAEQGNPQTVREKQCEAFYYIGMTHLLANEVDVARAFFVRCMATRKGHFEEFSLARAALERLEGISRRNSGSPQAFSQ